VRIVTVNPAAAIDCALMRIGQVCRASGGLILNAGTLDAYKRASRLIFGDSHEWHFTQRPDSDSGIAVRCYRGLGQRQIDQRQQ